MKKNLSIVVLALVLFACNSPKSAEYYASASATDGYEELSDDAILDADKTKELSEKDIKLDETIEKKIIKNGSLSLEVKDINVEKKNIDTLLTKFKGYYDNERVNNGNYNNNITLSLKIRVPSNKFELFLAAIEKNGGKVTNKEITSEDVTEEYIDLQTRLDNKQKYMARYQQLLSSAKNVKEVLEIQENIRKLEEEIESVTGRLKYLTNQVNYSTLDLTIVQKNAFKYVPENRPSVIEKLKESFIGGWFVFVDFIYILLYNWAIFIFFGVIIYFLIKYLRKRKQRKLDKKKSEKSE